MATDGAYQNFIKIFYVCSLQIRDVKGRLIDMRKCIIDESRARPNLTLPNLKAAKYIKLICAK